MNKRIGTAVATAVLAAGFGAVGMQAGAGTGAAAVGSIVYQKGTKIWVGSPDGKVKRRVPHAGSGFEFPSQADNGTIVAQRGLRFYRMNRAGKLLNEPIITAYRTGVLKGFKGPLGGEVSPDGKKIAYNYYFETGYFDPECSCERVKGSLNTAYSYSNRYTDRSDKVFGNPGFYWKASWFDNRRVVMTSLSFTDYAGNFLNQVAVDTIGGAGDKSYRTWFTECVNCNDIQTLKKYPLDDAELTRQRDKLVVVAGELGATEPGSLLFIYPIKAAPPALPTSFCRVSGTAGKFSSPTWSPDGKSLAWADRRGVWVGKVGNISGEACEITRRLVIPGGKEPDWGPARA